VELGTNHATAAAVSEASTRHEVAEGKASEDQESAFIVKLIQALDERDWSLVTTYTIDGATDYFGHRRASNAFIRKDIEGVTLICLHFIDQSAVMPFMNRSKKELNR
jgi:hypothetical protein